MISPRTLITNLLALTTPLEISLPPLFVSLLFLDLEDLAGGKLQGACQVVNGSLLCFPPL